jgi:hypothetical protein
MPIVNMWPTLWSRFRPRPPYNLGHFASVRAFKGSVADPAIVKETLKAQLAAAEARIDKQAQDPKVEAERAKVEVERVRTEQAIAAFASLADRLDAMAAEHARPWWRRLAG